jgi:7,8-dihydropterin-6-yl-methyl-4-(beta-D-ribofuranosyl)aminobenzene 5'-phosphate synthase
MPDTFAITVLCDNRAHDPGCVAEHGLSFWIETPGGRVLFDTGAGRGLGPNCERLGIELKGADAIVLSHGHDDHVGGLPWACSQAPGARLFMHPAAIATRYSLRGGRAHSIGMNRATRATVESRLETIVWTAQPTEVVPGVFVTGSIPRRTDYEDTGGPFYLDEQGREPDRIEDDQALWFATPQGLTVALGCAHSGVINTLTHIGRLTHQRPIRAVLGGMHLGAASDMRMESTICALETRNIPLIVPCHCTGEAGYARLAAALGERVQPCGAGWRWQG